jgi:branched-subunit amino acid transport protein AzlD
MDKLLKIGIIFMLVAVILLPVAMVLTTYGSLIQIIALIFVMSLELIGLIFVILSIVKRNKIKAQADD